MRKRNFAVTVGVKYGMLTIVKELKPYENSIRTYRMVLCHCECGRFTKIRLASVTCGQTKSCGCIVAKRAKTLAKVIHGLCEHPLYSVWEGMIARCYNKHSISYRRYGGRGIKVCKEWKSNFKSFYDWAIQNGWKEGLQIDRFPNNDGGYEPSNCRWATTKQNSRNKGNNISVQYKGKTYQLADACDLVGMEYGFVYRRIRKGMSFLDISQST